MRFKRLRITLGISIIIFILITANIILFGSLQEKALAISNKNSQERIIQVIQNSSQSSPVQFQNQVSTQNNSSKVISPPVAQPTIKTRAS